MSTIKTKKVQVGTDSTASNNFTIYTPGTPDGTVRIGNGNADSPTDRVTVTSAGNVGIGTSNPSVKLELNASSGNLIQKFNGATATHSIRNQADGSFGHFDHTNNRWLDLRDYTSDYYSLFTSGLERMRIDSSGRVTKPNTPAFMAYMNSNPAFSSLSANQLVPFNSTAFNNGNHFSTSTYIFTAPVTGYYQMNVYLRIDNVESTPSNYFHPLLSINDSETYNGLNLRLITSSSTSQIFESITDSQVWYLAANDTVRLKHGDTQAAGANGGSALYNGPQCRFSGYLIG